MGENENLAHIISVTIFQPREDVDIVVEVDTLQQIAEDLLEDYPTFTSVVVERKDPNIAVEIEAEAASWVEIETSLQTFMRTLVAALVRAVSTNPAPGLPFRRAEPLREVASRLVLA